MKEIKLSEIRYGDIIEIKSLEDYEEDGGDITDLIKKFAGQKCTVHKVVEEDGEITISAGNSDLGSCSFKEYEVAKAYRVEQKLVSAFDFYMAQVVPLEEEYRQEAYTIFVEDSLDEFIDYCTEKGSISEGGQKFFHYDMFLYELDEDGQPTNYFEDDYDKRKLLLEKVFNGEIEKYAEIYEEQENG